MFEDEMIQIGVFFLIILDFGKLSFSPERALHTSPGIVCNALSGLSRQAKKMISADVKKRRAKAQR